MKKGFTIVELLVVISVLVILIAITIPRFKGMQDSGKIAKAKKELQTIQGAIESYYSNQTQSPKQFPPSTTTICDSYLVPSSPQVISAALYDPWIGPSSTTE